MANSRAIIQNVRLWTKIQHALFRRSCEWVNYGPSSINPKLIFFRAQCGYQALVWWQASVVGSECQSCGRSVEVSDEVKDRIQTV